MFRASPAARFIRGCLVFLLLNWTGAHAHLIDAQKGSLILKAERAYLALSIPVSGFKGVDDNGDGLLSSAEFNLHRPTIEAQIRSDIGLSNATGPLRLDELMIQLSMSSDKPAPERQLLVMGHFALPDADKADIDEKKAIALMLANPSMIKRPVVEGGASLLVGFKPDIYDAEKF